MALAAKRVRRLMVAAVAGALLAGPVAGESSRPVVIGLFVPTRGLQAPAGREVIRGAELAVAGANRSEGIRGRRLALSVASSDLPWEQATGELVRLIYGEQAVAVVGALDGRTAHLAEQVITRARGQAVFVTPWASETTLTRIGIPWFFRLVPDDERQAAALAREIFSVRRLERVAVWVEQRFDSTSAAEAFLRIAPPGGTVRLGAGGREDLAAGLARGEFGALALFTSPAETADLIRWLSSRGHAPGILLGPLSLGALAFPSRDGETARQVLIPTSESRGTSSRAEVFGRDFKGAYGARPGLLAAYAHDAVSILVSALRQVEAGSRPSLEDALARATIQGITGRVRFDENRSREGFPELVFVRVGRSLPPPGPGTAERR